MLAAASLELKVEKQSAHSDWVRSVAFSPDGKTIVSGSDDQTLKVWTLSVWSHEPDTTVLPSGEKATELTRSLCALCFSTLSSREAATSVGALRFGLGAGSGRLTHLHPRL